MHLQKLSRYPNAKIAANIIANMHIEKTGRIGEMAADHIVAALERAGFLCVKLPATRDIREHVAPGQ